MATECYHELKALLNKKHETTLVGDEGGFVPKATSVEERLTLMQNAVTAAGYALHKDIVFSVDCAASEFYNPKTRLYHIDNKVYDSYRLSLLYEELCRQFPIASIEDPFAEDDWHAWQDFMKYMGRKIQIVGDDLLVTNKERIQKAVKQNACNALLLKVNQIGTLTEALEAAALAKKHKWNVVVSHRSGDTEDSFIADLAVGINAGQCKFGAPARSERTAKYNQLLRIEEALGNKAKYGVIH
jgi:enolase